MKKISFQIMKEETYDVITESGVEQKTRQVLEPMVFDCPSSTLDQNVAFVSSIAYNGEYTIEDIPMTAEEVRAKRDKLLADTDWTQVLDAPIDTETREAYRAYRQALRDIPEQEGFPETIVWPELPAKTKADPDPVDEAVDLLLSGATGEEATE